MTCTKTGCLVWIEPYQEWAYGDAFEIEPILLEDRLTWRQLQLHGLVDKVKNTAYFRLVSRSMKPYPHIPDREPDYIVHEYDNWFDQDSNLSLLITNNFTRNRA